MRILGALFLLLGVLQGVKPYYEGGITQLKFQTNKYNFMVVSINDDVPETPTFVDNLKATITAASKYLYSATKKRASIGRVFIRIPNSWTKKAGIADAPAQITLQKSDILISPPHASRRNFPFTRSYAGCGHPGIHIQLNTDFILKPGRVGASCTAPPICGKPDRFLVHEFATYRYGVFNEFPSPGESQYYFSPLTGKLERVRCSLGLLGRSYQRVNGALGACEIDPNTGSYTDTCQYSAYGFHNQGTSSIMEYPWRNEIVDFCDDTETDVNARKYGHNREPHTKQNNLCGHRSTWDVISHTQDFVNTNPVNSYADPTFNVFRATSRRKRMAVVLDTPQDDYERFFRVLHDFLTDGLQEETDVSIHHVVPSAHARKARSVNRVLHAMSNGNNYYATTFREGFHEAAKMLEAATNTSRHMVLVTCGETRINVETLPASDVIYHVINCREDTHNSWRPVVRAHGGLWHDVVDHTKTERIHHATHSLTQILYEDDNRPIMLLQEAFNKYFSNTSFTWDEYLDGDLLLTLHYSDHVPDHVMMLSPSAHVYSSKYRGYSVDLVLKVIRIKIPRHKVQVGSWQLSANTSGSDVVLVTIRCINRVPQEHFPITTRSWTKLFSDPPRVAVYSELIQGHHPVQGMRIEAHITGNNDKEYVIELLDNGAGADIDKEDGIYSRYFPHFMENSHSLYIYIRVHGNSGFIVSKQQLPSSQSYMTYDIPNIQYNLTRIPLKFGIHRSSSAGTIHFSEENGRLIHTVATSDEYMPSHIHDLRLLKVSLRDRTFTVSWTAPGRRLDHGKAHAYKMIYHNDTNLLLDFPSEAYVISDHLILSGRANQPSESGTTEMFTFRLPHDMEGLGMRIVAHNEDIRIGEFSNMITVGIPRDTDVEGDGQSELSMLHKKDRLEIYTPYVILLICAVCITGLVMFVMRCANMEYTRKKRTSIHTEIP